MTEKVQVNNRTVCDVNKTEKVDNMRMTQSLWTD